MSLNPNYRTGPGTDETAVALPLVIKRDIKIQTGRANPVLALMMERGPNKRSGRASFNDSDGSVLLPVGFDEVPEIDEASFGITRDQMRPTVMPNIVWIDDQTQARYPMAYLGANIGHDEWNKKVTAPGKRLNKVEAIKEAFFVKRKKIIDDMMTSAIGASSTRLQGLRHVLSTTNTVGGISQATNSAWRANSSAGSSSTLPEADIAAIQEALANIEYGGKNGYPDVLLASSSTAGGFSLYNKIKGWVRSQERIVDRKLKQVYGFTSFIYDEMAVVQLTKVAGELWALDLDSWYLFMDSSPQVEVQPIPGTLGDVYVFREGACLACDMPAANARRTGYTA